MGNIETGTSNTGGPQCEGGDEEQVERGIGHAAGNTRWEEWEQEVLRGTGSRTHSGWMGSETSVRVKGNETPMVGGGSETHGGVRISKIHGRERGGMARQYAAQGRREGHVPRG